MITILKERNKEVGKELKRKVKQKDVAVVVLNYVQYDSIKLGINALIKKGYIVDIIVPIKSEGKSTGFQEMFTNISQYLKGIGYNVINKKTSYEYKVLLEPYPFFNVKSKYKIRYRYGPISAKPGLVYVPINFLQYDVVLSSSKYEKSYLSAFANVHLVGNMKSLDVKKPKKGDKPVLLYLPTYGEGCSIEEIVLELNKLRKKYYVIAKIHHGTDFLNNEVHRMNLIKNSVDELYDSHKDLSSLLSLSNVVLTDHSAALFEALYVNIPVAIYADDINKYSFNNFDTIQYEMVKNGVVPYTNKPNEIKNVLEKALNSSQIKLQREWNIQNMFHSNDPVSDFVNIVEQYLTDSINKRYYAMHNIFKKYVLDMKNDNYKLEQDIVELKTISDATQIKTKNEIEKLEAKLETYQNELKYYENGKLYKIAKKIYKIKNGR